MSSPDPQQSPREFTRQRGQTPYNRQQSPYNRQMSDHSYRPPYQRNEKKYKKPNKLLSVLLGIISTFFLLLFIILSVLHSVSVTPIVQDVIDDLYIAYLLEDFDYHNEYYIWHQINGLPFNDTHVTYDDIEAFIKSDAVSGEIGGVLDGYIRAFTAGDQDHHITADDVIKISKNVKPELDELFDHQMTDEDIENFAAILDDILDFNTLNVDGMMDELNIVLPVPQFLVSTNMLFVTGIINVLLLFVIVFIRRNNLPDGFLSAAIPVFAAGLTAFISAIWLEAFSQSLSQTFHRYAIHIGGPAGYMKRYGFIFAGIGILIIVISFLIKRLGEKNERNTGKKTQQHRTYN